MLPTEALEISISILGGFFHPVLFLATSWC